MSCGVDTAAPAFEARRFVIRFASCGGWVVEGVPVPSQICMVLGGSWYILKACGVLRWCRFEKLRFELSVRYCMFSGSCFASSLQICFQNAKKWGQEDAKMHKKSSKMGLLSASGSLLEASVSRGGQRELRVLWFYDVWAPICRFGDPFLAPTCFWRGSQSEFFWRKSR